MDMVVMVCSLIGQSVCGWWNCFPKRIWPNISFLPKAACPVLLCPISSTAPIHPWSYALSMNCARDWNRHQCVFWFPIIWWSKSWTITLYVKDTTSMGRYPFLLDRNTISAIRKPCSRQLSAHSGIIEKYALGIAAQSVSVRTYPDWKAGAVGLCAHRQRR